MTTDYASLTLDDAVFLTAAARRRGAQPRVHPNGFIQLDLEAPADERWHEGKQAGHSGADLRLHVWNPPGVDLPHQDTVNEIHDHVFDMRSTVVRGELTQRLYEFVIGGVELPPQGQGLPAGEGPPALEQTHEIYRAVYDKTSSSRLESLGVRGYLRNVADQWVRTGQSYTQPAFTLHDSQPGSVFLGTRSVPCVVTLMQKTAVHDGIPTVVCPLGQSPDNDFDRATAAPQELLWEAINASLS